MVLGMVPNFGRNPILGLIVFFVNYSGKNKKWFMFGFLSGDSTWYGT